MRGRADRRCAACARPGAAVAAAVKGSRAAALWTGLQVSVLYLPQVAQAYLVAVEQRAGVDTGAAGIGGGCGANGARGGVADCAGAARRGGCSAHRNMLDDIPGFVNRTGHVC